MVRENLFIDGVLYEDDGMKEPEADPRTYSVVVKTSLTWVHSVPKLPVKRSRVASTSLQTWIAESVRLQMDSRSSERTSTVEIGSDTASYRHGHRRVLLGRKNCVFSLNVQRNIVEKLKDAEC